MALIHEMFGLQAAQLEERVQAFNKTIDLLAELKAGTKTLDMVEITPDRGWKLVPAPTKPEAQEHPRPEPPEG